MTSIKDLSPEQRLLLLAEQAQHYGILMLDENGTIIQWSVGAQHLTGWTAQEAVGQPVDIIFTPEDKAAGAPQAEIDRARRTGHAPDVRWHVRKDGSCFFVDGILSAIKDETGAVIGFGKTLIDITKRKQAADFAEKKPSLLDLSYDPTFSWDLEDDRIQYWNKSAEELYGFTAKEAVGQSVHHLLATELSGSVEEIKQSLSSTGRWQGELIHTCKNGQEVHIQSRMVLRTDLGPQLIVLETNRDVTEQKHAAEALQASEERFRTLVSATAQIVWRGEADGAIVADSPSWRAFTGQSYEEWTGFGWTNALHPDDPPRIVPMWQQCVAERRIFEAEHRVRRIDGQYRWTAVRAVPIMNSDGSIREWIGMNTDIQERKEAEERLRLAEEQLRAATDAAELGIWIWETDKDKASWENDRMWELIGLPPEAEAVNVERFINEFIHPDDVGPYQRAIENSLRTGERFHFVGRFFKAPNKELRWFEFTGLIHAAEDGTSQRMIGTAADITERKLAEETLKETRTRLEATLEAGEIATWIWNIPSNRVTADRNLAKLFGVGDEIAAGAPIEAYLPSIHPDDIDRVSSLIQSAIESGRAYQASYRVRNAQGKYRWVIARGRVEQDADGKPVSLPGVVLDVTEQKEAEEALRTTQERYRTLITSMDDGFCVIELMFDAENKPIDYRFIETNPAFDAQTGLVNAVGKTIKEIVPNIEGHWIQTYGRVALTGEPIRFVEEAPSLGRWFDAFATRLGDRDERKVAVLFSDITLRKEAEEKLRQLAADLSEANRRKTEFLATLAHELRNPLAPIRTGMDLIRLSGNAPGSSGRVVDMMDRQLNQMVHLINDLMDISRVNSGKIVLKKECIELRSAITSAVEATLPLIESAQHQLDMQIPAEPIMLDVDPTRLAQILSNLLTNAAKYTPSQGRITITACREQDGTAISVSDTGIGIPKEELSGVFEMFSQVSRNMGHAQGGLGIGLSLVRNLVEMHGGTVAVASEGVGTGSTFTVRFPLAEDCYPEESVSENSISSEHSGQKQQRQILIADDNQDAATSLAALLQVKGYPTTVVHDGRQALEKAKEVKPDLAILDIGMPGLNGYEVAAELRNVPGLEGIFLVALTGWGGEEDRNRSAAAGFDFHLTKPAYHDEINRLLLTLEHKTKGQYRGTTQED